MNPRLSLLQPYPFEKLRALNAGAVPPSELAHIPLSIGEPKHEAPRFVIDTLNNNIGTITNYPVTKGIDALRAAIASWATTRFKLKPNTLSHEDNVLPVNGTREALFAFTQAVIDGNTGGKVVTPNPFYQIYEGAALLAGAEPYFIPTDKTNSYLPNFEAVPETVWRDCQLIFICSPGNPTGAVLPFEKLSKLIELADRYNFIIASDECYSELYFDEDHPPIGLLEACARLGRDNFERCVVFHSLSKRSNLPGLRSGFVAGDKKCLQDFLRYRTYHGCAMPVFSQHASIAAWNDEAHVAENRKKYREKFDAVLDILAGSLNVSKPDASFYLWPETPVDDQLFAQRLFAEKHVTVLPGSYLAREVNGYNPGKNHVRMALVAPLAECVEAAQRIKDFITTL